MEKSSESAGGNVPVLRVQGLQFGFPGHPLFARWEADFPAGLSLVLGGDGAGKTSLLRLLAGAVNPQAGRLVLHGVDAVERSDDYRAQVFWRDPRAPWPDMLTPQGWVDTIVPNQVTWSSEDWDAHVTGFGLLPHLHKPMHQLSSGSQRKVLLAAALASGAALTLIDEPVAALDKPSITYLLQALRQEAMAPRVSRPARALVLAHYELLEELPWRNVVML